MAHERSEPELAANFAAAFADVRAGRPSAAECPEAARVAEAVAWAKANRAGGASGPCAPVAASPMIEAESDQAWFAAHPNRLLRVRQRTPADPAPHWADRATCGLVAVAHRNLPGAEFVAIDAVGGDVPDSDEGARAALRRQREWRATAGRLT